MGARDYKPHRVKEQARGTINIALTYAGFEAQEGFRIHAGHASVILARLDVLPLSQFHHLKSRP